MSWSLLLTTEVGMISTLHNLVQNILHEMWLVLVGCQLVVYILCNKADSSQKMSKYEVSFFIDFIDQHNLDNILIIVDQGLYS